LEGSLLLKVSLQLLLLEVALLLLLLLQQLLLVRLLLLGLLLKEPLLLLLLLLLLEERLLLSLALLLLLLLLSRGLSRRLVESPVGEDLPLPVLRLEWRDLAQENRLDASARVEGRQSNPTLEWRTKRT
jgi:hypothetical protein